MSQQTGYTDTTPVIPGLGASPVPTLIPNGQPPQWTKPPISYSAKQQRPPVNGQRPQSSSNPFAANGTQTPQNPGSLSSQSSRDPSPAPSSASTLSSSTPNLASLDNTGRQPGRVPVLPSNPYTPLQTGSGSPLRIAPHGSSHPHLSAGASSGQQVQPEQRYSPAVQQMGFSSPHINGPNVGIPPTSRIVRTNMEGTVARSDVQDGSEHLDQSPKNQELQRQMPYAQPAVTQQQSSGQVPSYPQQQGQRMQGDHQVSAQFMQPGQHQLQGPPTLYSGVSPQKIQGMSSVQQASPVQAAFQTVNPIFKPQVTGQQHMDQSSPSQQLLNQRKPVDRPQPQGLQSQTPAGNQYQQSVSVYENQGANPQVQQAPQLARTNLTQTPVNRLQGQNQFSSSTTNQRLVNLPEQTFVQPRAQGPSQIMRPPLNQPVGQAFTSEPPKSGTQLHPTNQFPQPPNQLSAGAPTQQPYTPNTYGQARNNPPANQFSYASSQPYPQSSDSHVNSSARQMQEQQQQHIPGQFPPQQPAGASYQSGITGPASPGYPGQNIVTQMGTQQQHHHHHHQQQQQQQQPQPQPVPYKPGASAPTLTQFAPSIPRSQDQGPYLPASQGPPQMTHPPQLQQQQPQQQVPQQLQQQQHQQQLLQQRQQQQQQQQQPQPQQQLLQQQQQHPVAPWLNTQVTPIQQQQQQHHPLVKRYPQQPDYQPTSPDNLSQMMSGMSVAQQGFNKLWGHESCDLLQNRNILPPEKIEPPKIRLHQEFLDSVNCSPDIFRCTLTKIPETSSLLQKSRLPLGILIHPFKDLNHLPVIQCNTIVRCRSCRTYINPFVYFVDHKRWKCNLCFRANELPEEFQFDPVSKSFGDPSRRPEIKSSTIEFIAPSEYMLRPPQPAVYLFVLDVSALAVESGYLQIFCETLLEELDKLPGDARTTVGFITFDSTIHFYSLAEGLSQPHQMIVVDTDDVFLPCPDNLLVNLAECRELVRDLLQQLPQKFSVSHDSQSVLGAALQAAHKLISPTGGRVTVFQSCLPNQGPGALTPREDPSQRAGKDAPHLNPATDFYKRLALDCSGHQVAVDLFIVNSQYCDLATISGISRFSGGCIHHFPLFKASNVLQAEYFQRSLKRYLTRKIGFEAVMRIRCSRGLAIHTFHGNFFVRSTDLLSLPNVNPDAGFGMQISIEESLTDLQNVCFQAALLYTSSKGERRIRVHTLCLPVATGLADILHSADQQCIVGLLAKMAVDRSHESSLSDARDAFINVAIDVLSAYRLAQGSAAASGGLVAPFSLRLLPLYILALLKYTAFRTGQSTRLDDRLFAMCQMKNLPLALLIQSIYPDMYPVHSLSDQGIPQENGEIIPQPPRLHLSAEKLDFRGAFLMDTGDHMIIYVGRNVAPEFCINALGVQSFSMIPEDMYELPELETIESGRLRRFINHLQSEKPVPATLEVIRDDSPRRGKFLERLIEDRTESALSYYEFLQHLKSNIK
ncbi:protein transport protein Sec24A [Schistocerca americana]|uniref:protein transport protein Sec24A n=1 Tax=Schistocerca americana TaxID=7009 RepID=UPI001F4FCA70|nr:protein transport protein Sec24A [Schistocerca americana]XP_047005170.1 protein transport protein Sec24A [Schistocerca americana]